MGKYQIVGLDLSVVCDSFSNRMERSFAAETKYSGIATYPVFQEDMS